MFTFSNKRCLLLQLQIYKKSHFYTQAQDKELYSFVQNVDSNLLTIYIVWGLSLKDRSSCHFSSIECRGTEVYDSSFDPNPAANQIALKVNTRPYHFQGRDNFFQHYHYYIFFLQDFCDYFYNMTSSDFNTYNIKTDASGNPEIACFTRDLETYLKVGTIISSEPVLCQIFNRYLFVFCRPRVLIYYLHTILVLEETM